MSHPHLPRGWGGEPPNDGLVSIDIDGVIVAWDDAAEAILGWSAQETLGRSLADVIAPPSEVLASLTALARNQEERRATVAARRLSLSALHRDGHLLPVELTARATLGDNPVVTALISDISGPLRAQDAVIAELRAAVAAAEAAEERSRTFLADAAHQLRQPITGVRACAESLLGDPSRADRHRLLANMVRGTARAGQLVTSLLQMARLDQGEHVLTPMPCDVLGIVTDEADRLYSLAPNLDIVLRAERLDDDRPAVDAEAIRDVVANLLDNARRYAVNQISLTLTVDGDILEIRVADDGPGLPDELIDRVFERFVTIGDHGGSGLGLAIARGLARAHGGDLVYAGAFVLRVPVATDPAETTSG